MDRRRFLLNSTSFALVSQGRDRFESAATAGNISIGDSLIQVDLAYGPGGLKEDRFRVGAQEIPSLSGIPWVLSIPDHEVVPAGSRVLYARKAANGLVQAAEFEGKTNDFTWKLKYELTGPGRITKTLALTPGRGILLRDVSLWNAIWTREPTIARTKVQDIAAFYRHQSHGLFVSLDFPFSRIQTEKGLTQVAYPPFEKLLAGQTHIPHSLTVGSLFLTGEERFGFDTGEVRAMDSYIQGHVKPRFNRPMFVTSSINNRYMQVEGDIVFYTMRDQPTLSSNTDLLKGELALVRNLGMEYYQVFPGVFDWVDGGPAPETVKEIVDDARAHGLRMGDYSGCNYLFCPHYNEYRKSLDRPAWLMRDQDGRISSPGAFCFGGKEFVQYYADTVAANCRRFRFELHCLDFLRLSPCYATGHGHPPGQDSLYHQVQGLARVMESINSVSPQMMTWSNSGNWQELLPKIAWYNHNLYLTDPFIQTPWQGLNMTRLLDDARREQMVSLHYSRFLPYRFFSNCQYFFCQNSVVPDLRNFEYGALSTIAVTPNLSLGEVRPWIDKLPAADQERVLSFYKRWTRFLQENYALWKTTYHAGEDPGMGSVEIYSHASGTRGFIFVVNPQYWTRTVEIPLDATTGFSETGKCEIRELYPVERLRLTAQGPFVSLGTKFPMHVDAQQALVLEVRPAPDKIDAPRLYGLPGSIEPFANGYMVKTTGAQGSTTRFAVLAPPGSPNISAAAVRPDIPKQPKRSWAPTPVKVIAADEQATLLEITFRRKPAPTELRDWVALPGEIGEGLSGKWNAGIPQGTPLRFPLFMDAEENDLTLPISDEQADRLRLGPLANFCGAYIDHAFAEAQTTWLELNTSKAELPRGKVATAEAPPVLAPLHPLAKDKEVHWWLQTRFYLPFMNTLGCEPSRDEHPILVLPLLRHDRVKAIDAWINGTELKIEQYRYPRNRKLACYYVDLIGSGAAGNKDNLLIIHLSAANS